MSRRSRRLFLAICTGTALASGAAGLPALADSGTQVVSYHGYEVEVPATWPVVNLDAHPGACVRFDSPAVYVGTPGDVSDCPASISGGRTAGLVISPLDARSVATTTADTATAATPAGAAEAASVNHRIQAAVEDAGVLVSAVHNSRTESQVRDILASAQLVDGARPATLASFAPRSARAAAPIVAPGTLTDNAFDTCTAQSQSTMDAWRESPFRAVGIYTSGVNRACGQDLLTPEWVGAQSANGWQFIVIHHGLEAPCNPRYTEVFSTDPATARQQGVDEANAAIASATALGFGAGSAIYTDIEAYDGCTDAVMSFVSGWAEGLRAAGWLSGMYSSGASGVADLCANYDNAQYTMPDHLWFAWWNDRADTDSGQYCSNDYFTGGRRLHQYVGDTSETYGGVTVNIDRDFLDVHAAALRGVPA
jgi:glycoside hydrolase-like protein